MYASRLWWMLRYVGHDQVRVLEGGLVRWCEEGRPTRGGREARPAAHFVAQPRPSMRLTASDVEARLPSPSWRFIDARAPERYRGEIEPVDRVAGHIPGAVNLPYRDSVEADGTFLPADRVRERFAAATGEVRPEHVTAYCGSGVSACHLILSLERAGIHGVKLYAGSWSEWSSDPARPVEVTRK
jgi:thiosulfate/3-mercaptopyruvate sulfurtransferase